MNPAILPNQSSRISFGHAVEHFLETFLEEAANPAAILAMGAGRLAYLGGRAVVLNRLWGQAPQWWNRGRLGAVVASASGFALEPPALLGVRGFLEGRFPDAKQAASTALLLGALRVGDGTARLFESGRKSSVLLNQFSMFGGVLLAKQLADAVGSKNQEGSVSSSVTESIFTLLHFHIGGAFARKVFGNRFEHPFASGSIFQSKIFQNPSHSRNLFPAPLTVSAAPHPRISQASPKIPNLFMSASSAPPFPTPGTALVLKNRYLPQFQESQPDSRAIVDMALNTCCSRPQFHEKLLQAYVQSPNRGTAEQFYTARALQYLFDYDALNSSTGSFDNAVLQALVENVLSSPSTVSGEKIQHLLEAMESGLTRTRLEKLVEHLGDAGEWEYQTRPFYPRSFWQTHHREASHAWKNYRDQDYVPLLNAVFQWSGGNSGKASRLIARIGEARESGTYNAAGLDSALDYARQHPWGALVLKRFFHIVATGDLAAKLLELSPQPDGHDILFWFLSLKEQGFNLEQIAQRLKGTSHAAYLDDIRLSRKLVSVLQEIHPYLLEPDRRRPATERLEKAILDASPALGRGEPEALLQVLKATPHSQTPSLEKHWRKGRFQIEIVSGEEFDKAVGEWLGSPDCKISFYLSRGHPRQGGKILIREWPPIEIRNQEGRSRLQDATVFRITALLHEFEHWRHFGGFFEAEEAGSSPIEFHRVPREGKTVLEVTRQDRLVSEILSFLEEQRWAIKNSNSDYWEVARRLGENLPMFWRNNSDWGYFGRENRKRIREWFAD